MGQSDRIDLNPLGFWIAREGIGAPAATGALAGAPERLVMAETPTGALLLVTEALRPS